MMKAEMSRWWYSLAAAVALLAPAVGRSQSLMTTALSAFSPQTVHVEYSDSAKLRSLSDYASLRQRYLSPRLKQLEGSMAQLGIHEGDIDEVVLGWRGASSSDDMYGVASGRFDSQAMATRAASKGIKPTLAADTQVYCLEDTCVALRDASTGFFGPLSTVKGMLKPGSHLDGDAEFTRLVDEADQSTPIWGVAKGAAVVDWFKATMPGQDSANLDWNTAFQGVNSVTYSLDAGDSVRLAMKLDCASSQAAASLRQLFEGLRLLQRMAWQSKNPTLPNPYQSLTVDVQQSEVSLKLETPHAALAGFR
ncbi:MAG: hypothetical protein ACLQOO_27905 [Terriglobia bacterium]